MKSLDQFFQSDIVHALGWTIIHSFWQGLLIVLLLTIGLVLLRRHSSQLRYIAGYFALLTLTSCSIVTFFWNMPDRSADTYISSGSMYSSEVTTEAVSMTEITAPVLAGENYWQLFIRFTENNLPLITMIWMLGVLFLTLRFLAEMAYIQRLKYQPGQLSVVAHQDLLNQLSKQMGIDKFIELKENIRINSPMVIGFIKPVILVPFGLLSRLDTDQVESILAHELAHIRRYDYVFNLFQSLVEIVLFFNPATWWISSFIRSEREHCCDEMAIAETGNQLVFVQTLAKLEEYRTLPNNLALAFNGQRDAGVLGRVKRILNSEEQFRLPYKLFWSCIILLGSIGLFAFQDQPVPVQNLESTDQINTISPDSEPLENLATVDPVSLSEEMQPTILEKTDENSQKKRVGIQETHEEEASTIIPFIENTRLNSLDTVPGNLKKLRQELIQLEKSFHEQEMVMQKQSRDIQTEMQKLEWEVKKMENERLKELYELEKSAQELELNRKFQLQELEVEYNTIRNETQELEYKRQQLEMRMKEEGLKEELQKQHSEFHRQLLDLKKKKQELELSQKRSDLNVEKEVQLINKKRWQLQKEAEIMHSDKQLKIMELQQKMQEMQFKSQLLQSEKQNKMQLLQMQMQEEVEKWEEKNKGE